MTRLVVVKRSASLLCAAVLVLTAHSARAGVNTWTGHGPSAGHVTFLAIDPQYPNTLYAGTQFGGLYKSSDGARTWNALSSLNQYFINAVAIDPGNSSLLYAGCGGGAFKSTDGGATWSAAGAPNIGWVNAVVVAPSAPRIVYAGTEQHGIFKSTDAGATWVATGHIAADQIAALAVDPTLPDTVYAGTEVGMFKSTDGGASWSAANDGLPDGFGVAVLTIDANDPSVLYAAGGSAYSGFGGGLFKSTDAGVHWYPLDARESVSAVVIDPTDSTRLFFATADYGNSSSLLRSDDGGITWQSANLSLPLRSIRGIVIDPINADTLYAGSGAGVFKSTDAGAHWDLMVAGITNTSVHAIAVDPAAPDTLYAGTWHDGMFKSSDRGGTWTAANGTTGIISVSALLIDPSPASTLLAGGNGGGLLKSTDGASTWSLTGPRDLVSVLAIDPTDPAILYAGGGYDAYKSADGGLNWKPLGFAPEVFAIAIDPNDPSIVYAEATSCNPVLDDPSECTLASDVFKSIDAGATWKKTGLVNVPVSVVLTVAGTVPSTVFAATAGNGLKASTDGGDTWTVLATRLQSNFVPAVAADRTIPTTVYAGGGGVSKSTDGGQTWHRLNGGGLRSTVIALAIDPTNPDLVYAGTDGQGVLSFEEILTPTPTFTPRPTATPEPCLGDCDGDGSVTVNEILTMVSISLENADISVCRAGDANGDRAITVDEIVAAVNNAFDRCA